MAKSESKTEVKTHMKVTLTGTLAGPDGIARPGTVLDVPQAQADELLKGRFARPFDKERDAKSPQGLTRASNTDE